jgi:glycerol-3-phosphate O-acyltransferase/dihydroxyacetone phosphate acyltransferase
MLYHYLKPLVHLGFLVYFRKIYISNRHNIPKDHAILFACNHPTAFIDPMIVCVNVRPMTHFILRGDLFGKPIITMLLEAINMIPIYRFRDGFDSLRKNQETMERCYRILDEGKRPLIIMAEGQMSFGKRLQKIQKGTARMALGAYQAHGTEKIAIVPTGINYSNPTGFRSSANITFGEPILLKDYLDMDERKAALEMTRTLQSRLNDLVVHFDRQEDVPWAMPLINMHRSLGPKTVWPIIEDDDTMVKEDVAESRVINNMDEVQVKHLREDFFAYKQALEENSVRDEGLVREWEGASVPFLFLLLGLPLFLVGWGIHWPFLGLWLIGLAGRRRKKWSISYRSALR